MAAVRVPSDPFPDNQRRTLYAISTPSHDVHDFDVFESHQPWYRPIPVTTAEYAGKLVTHEYWRRLRLNVAEDCRNLWRAFQQNQVEHLHMWTAYHMISDSEVQGIDCYFAHWKPLQPQTTVWERYWLRDSPAPYVTRTRVNSLRS